MIAVSYFFIPFGLIDFVRKRKDLAFNWMFVLFGIFIFACGATHVMSIWTLWHGTYRLDGMVKLVTAMASFPTAVLLYKLIRVALALPSPAELRQLNLAMQVEITERKRIEVILADRDRAGAEQPRSWSSSPPSPRTTCRSRCARSRRSATGSSASAPRRWASQGRDYLDRMLAAAGADADADRRPAEPSPG